MTISRVTAFGGTAFVPRLRRDLAERGAERTCFQLSVDAPAALFDSELTEIFTVPEGSSLFKLFEFPHMISTYLNQWKSGNVGPILPLLGLPCGQCECKMPQSA